MDETMTAPDSSVKIVMEEPVIAALSAPDEQRWGFHQFPKISRLPSDEILLTFADQPDAISAHGHNKSPAFISSDSGKNWVPVDENSAYANLGGGVSEVFDGEFIYNFKAPSYHIENMSMPEPIANFICYQKWLIYTLEDCPDELRNYSSALPAKRWIPQEKHWMDESIKWDTDSMLVTVNEEPYLGKTSFESKLLRHEDSLLIAEYRSKYRHEDGSLPSGCEITLMKSDDNGKSFQRQALIASAMGKNLTEPILVKTSDGGLACVIRLTDQEIRPMLISYSNDGGYTWTPTRQLYDFGVLPQFLRLENGIIALSFGRPGVQLSFSPDGSAKQWTKPIELVRSNLEKPQDNTCGYTSLLPLSKNSFLMAYSDFEYKDDNGTQSKAIIVREVTVEPHETTS